MRILKLVPAAIASALVLTLTGCEGTRTEPVNLEELIARHMKARGGIDRIGAIDTVTLEGKYFDSEDATPFTEYYRPPYYLAEARLFGRRLLQAYDGKITWWKMPPLGIREAVTIPEEDFRSVMLPYNARHFGGLATTNEPGVQTTFAGREELDGKSMFKVLVKARDDLEVWHFLFCAFPVTTQLSFAFFALDLVFDQQA